MGSSEEEIKNIITDLGIGPYFLGTFDKYFPGFLSKEKMVCAIVNTGSRAGGGVHWLAMAWFPKAGLFYMFDPFGFSDKKLKIIYNFEYQKLLKRSALQSTSTHCVQLVTSTESIQGPQSAACGLFCCMFLYAFVHWPLSAMKNPVMNSLQGVPNSLLFREDVQPILKRNQMLLYNFLSKHSAYFRKHRNEIQHNTKFNKL